MPLAANNIRDKSMESKSNGLNLSTLRYLLEQK